MLSGKAETINSYCENIFFVQYIFRKLTFIAFSGKISLVINWALSAKTSNVMMMAEKENLRPKSPPIELFSLHLV